MYAEFGGASIFMSKKSFHKVLPLILALVFIFTGCSSSKFSGSSDKSKTETENTLTQSENQDSQNDKTIENSSDNENVTENTGVKDNDAETGDNSAQTEPDSSAEPDKSTEPEKEAVKVKGLYLTGWTVGSNDKVNHYVQLANETEINAYVVDIKDDDGFVGYESQLAEVRNNGAYKKKYNADNVLKAFHDNGIYVIGRLVAFKDPVYSTKRPDLSIKKADGSVWKDNKGLSWLNPYNKENWDYLISIAQEAVDKGFDEIQFDYVRFPSDGKKQMSFAGADKEKYEIIREFLEYAKTKITKVPVSADVFGIILESPADTEKIGQYLEYVGKDVDYICPMVYPSHYAVGQIVNNVTFSKPDLDPYGVVYNSLVKCKNRIDQISDHTYNAKVRPYLQDFTASWLGKGYYQDYGADQVKQQIKAVYDAGYEEWILWDASNTYHETAFVKEVK
jgi:hypothetical protein